MIPTIGINEEEVFIIILDWQCKEIKKVMEMTIEQMRQKCSEARQQAKTLQRNLQTITDPDERKQMAQQMNDLFALAKSLKDEAKHRHYQEESIEREFLSLKANLEDI